jgi:hypothetical protein
MNRDDDFIAQLEDYLDTYEGVVPLPASVRDAVHARLPETRQVRGALGPERMLEMVSGLSAAARWGIGIAALLVVLVGAAALFTGGRSASIAAAPTPAPSASPTQSPSPASEAIPLSQARSREDCGDGLGSVCIAPGTYRLTSDTWPARISFEVPMGWWHYIESFESEGILVESGPTAPDGSGWGPMFFLVGEVSKDPCDPSAGRYAAEQAATVDGLVALMRSWPGFEVSEAQPIEIDGRAGQRVEVTSTRTGAGCDSASMWQTRGGIVADAYPMAGVAGHQATGTFRIFDVDGTPVVLRTLEFADPSPHELGQGVAPDPTRHAADLVELHEMIDSIQIGS